jgi:HNH endonuclease
MRWPPLADRLWSKVAVNPDGCWLWTGARGKNGYGQITVAGRRGCRPHRVVYELFHGPIPVGLEVCHRCDHPLCLRLDHLFLGSHAENMRDMSMKGRAACPHPSRYRFLAPDGTVHEGVNVRAFARRHGLDHSCLRRLLRGHLHHHHGYRVAVD